MLLDPLEEELDLPAMFVEERDRICGYNKIVREEDVNMSSLRITIFDATERVWILLLRLHSCEENDLVTNDSHRFVDEIRVSSLEEHVVLCPGNEECACLVEFRNSK